MNQIDYQPTQNPSFNPASAFAGQAQIHSGGGQSFFPRNSGGPQAFSQASYPGPHKQQQQNGGGGFNFPAGGLNVNVNGALTNNVSQQQSTGQQTPYTSVSSAATVSGGHAGANHALSPFRGTPPQSAGLGHGSSQGQMHVQQSPMSAPSNFTQASPRTPAKPQSHPQPPPSPASLAREKERLEVLLDINNELLQELHNLQTQGKGGASSQEHLVLMKKQGANAQMGSEEFIQVTLRVHANLGYLCGASDYALRPGSKQAPHPPNYVHAPPGMPHLAEKYGKLRALFPGWAGYDGRKTSTSAATASATAQANGINFGASASPTTGNSIYR